MQELLTALFYGRHHRDPKDGEMVEYIHQWWKWDDLTGKWSIVSETKADGPLERRLSEMQFTQILMWAVVIFLLVMVILAKGCGIW